MTFESNNFPEVFNAYLNNIDTWAPISDYFKKY